MKKYIGFLLPLVFIFGTNNGFAETTEPQDPPPYPPVYPQQEPITSEIMRNTLILQEVNRCQAGVLNVAKFINLTDAVLVTIEPKSSALNKIDAIRGVIREKFDTLAQIETKTLENIDTAKGDVATINNQAVEQFELIAATGINVFNEIHTDEGYNTFGDFLATMLQGIGTCETTIAKYIEAKIQ